MLKIMKTSETQAAKIESSCDELLMEKLDINCSLFKTKVWKHLSGESLPWSSLYGFPASFLKRAVHRAVNSLILIEPSLQESIKTTRRFTSMQVWNIHTHPYQTFWSRLPLLLWNKTWYVITILRDAKSVKISTSALFAQKNSTKKA